MACNIGFSVQYCDFGGDRVAIFPCLVCNLVNGDVSVCGDVLFRGDNIERFCGGALVKGAGRFSRDGYGRYTDIDIIGIGKVEMACDICRTVHHRDCGFEDVARVFQIINCDGDIGIVGNILFLAENSERDCLCAFVLGAGFCRNRYCCNSCGSVV